MPQFFKRPMPNDPQSNPNHYPYPKPEEDGPFIHFSSKK
jgi:hypothetical protein